MKKDFFLLLGAFALVFSLTGCDKNDEFNCIHNDNDSTIVIRDTILIGGGPVIDPCALPEVITSVFILSTEVDAGDSEILAGISINIDTCCVSLQSMSFTCTLLSASSDDLSDFMSAFNIFADHEQLAVVNSSAFQRISNGVYRIMVDMDDLVVCNGNTVLKISVDAEDDMDDGGSIWKLTLDSIRHKDHNGEVVNQVNIIPNSTQVRFVQ